MTFYETSQGNLCIHNISIAALWHDLDKNFRTDYKTGFGGQFGVQTDRVDKNAVGWEHNEKV